MPNTVTLLLYPHFHLCDLPGFCDLPWLLRGTMISLSMYHHLLSIIYYLLSIIYYLYCLPCAHVDTLFALYRMEPWNGSSQKTQTQTLCIHVFYVVFKRRTCAVVRMNRCLKKLSKVFSSVRFRGVPFSQVARLHSLAPWYPRKYLCFIV